VRRTRRRTAEQEGTVFSTADVKILHHGLEGVFQRSVGVRVCIRLADMPLYVPAARAREEWWETASAGATVEFATFPSDASVPHLAAARSTGTTCFAFPLCADREGEAQPWVSWYEAWEGRSAGHLRLGTASLSLFWGRPRSVATQLLRAEWHDPGGPGARAPQPHWHLDERQLVSVYGPPGSVADRSLAAAPAPVPLEALPSQSDSGQVETEADLQDLDLSGVHLGMAGWSHDDLYAKCWQHPLDTSESLLRWARRVIEHTLCEFGAHPSPQGP